VPGQSKAIRKRIKSVTSTMKITRTMEMVATSKLQRTQGRVVSSRPYMLALAELMRTLSGAVEAAALHPLFERRDTVRRVLVFLVTSNRGLCGGYNANLVRKAREHVRQLQAEGMEAVLFVSGRKGIAALRFQGVTMADTRTDLSDRPTVAEAEAVAEYLTTPFLEREVDRVDVVFADFRTVAHQPPVALTLLPVGGGDQPVEEPSAGASAAAEGAVPPAQAHEYLFEPSAWEILEELGVQFLKSSVYRMLLSAVASEQLARRVAMKSATDNAKEMQRSLTRAYNRARQAQITQEIAEIVGGAAALD
jgi:F-type H+-transporting ATPase subunit gamma